MTRSLSPLGAVVSGVIAGAVGIAVMDLVLFSRYKRGGGTSGFSDWETSAGLNAWKNAPAPAHVGKRMVEGLLKRELPPERARLTSNVMHWSYGSAWAALFGIVAGSRVPRVRYGLLFGPLVWAAGYAMLAPMKLYKPMWEYDAKTLYKDLSAHIAYGVATAATFKALVRRG